MNAPASLQTACAGRYGRIAPMNSATGANSRADRLLLNGKRQELSRRGSRGIGVGFVKPALDVGVNLHVARVAEGQHVVEGVVPLGLRVAHAPVVDVVDVGSVGVAAHSAPEVIPLQGLKVIPVTVLGDELGIPRTAFGTVELSGSGALSHRPANAARELYAALGAGFDFCVSRVKLITAAVARLRVEFVLRVFVSKLANFASRLELVVNSKLGFACDTVSVSKRSFGHAEIYLIGRA